MEFDCSALFLNRTIILEIKIPHYGRISTIPQYLVLQLVMWLLKSSRLKTCIWFFWEHNVYIENQNNDDDKK